MTSSLLTSHVKGPHIKIYLHRPLPTQNCCIGWRDKQVGQQQRQKQNGHRRHHDKKKVAFALFLFFFFYVVIIVAYGSDTHVPAYATESCLHNKIKKNNTIRGCLTQTAVAENTNKSTLRHLHGHYSDTVVT